MKGLWLYFLLPVIALAAEKTPEPQDSSKTNVPVSSIPADYKLRPLDMVDIRVFQEEDLTMTNKVSQAGTLTFP